MGWQGWAQRPGGTCHETTRPPTCTITEITARAGEGRTADTATVEYDGGGWSVWFRDIDPGEVKVADACNPR